MADKDVVAFVHSKQKNSVDKKIIEWILARTLEKMRKGSLNTIYEVPELNETGSVEFIKTSFDKLTSADRVAQKKTDYS